MAERVREHDLELNAEALLAIEPRRLVALYTAARGLAAADSGAAVARALLEGLTQAAGCAGAALYLPEPANPHLMRLAAARGTELPAPTELLLPAAPRATDGQPRELLLLGYDWPAPHGALLLQWGAAARPAGWEAARDALLGDAVRALARLHPPPTARGDAEGRSAAARADQERSRAVVDATNDAVLMLDERRRTLIANRRARFFFGLGEHELLGRSAEQLGELWERIVEDAPRFTGWLAGLLGSQSDRGLTELRLRSPEPRLLQCFSAPVIDRHDQFLGRLLVFRDITREREVEQMKSDFVSIVSHELRTPLTSIQGALQLVLGQPEQGRAGLGDNLAPRARELLSISRANTERLIRMINDILDIAKIEQGRIGLRRAPVDPAALCRLAVAEMGALASGRAIQITLRIAERLPEALADRDRALQVLVNLLSNAIKFSQPGQQVLLTAQQHGEAVRFTVQDWGRGIAPEHQAALFQKFQQLDSSPTRDVGGTGLGLAISKALVEQQGGKLWLESTPQRGSSFSFTLPVANGEGGR